MIAYCGSITANFAYLRFQNLPYKNKYAVPRRFILSTSRHDLLTVKEKYLLLREMEEATIALRFHPQPKAHNVDLLLFVQDEQGNVEDTFSLKTAYSAAGR